MIKIEQKIITGLDNSGSKINNTKLVMEVSQIAKDIDDIDYLRMLIIYIVCFELSSKDKSTMLKSLNDEKHRQIVQNLEYLDENLVDRSKSKFRRRNKEMSKEDFIEYQRKKALNEFEIIRSEPKIVKYLKQIHLGILDHNKFPYVEQPVTKKKDKGEKKLNKGADTYQLYGEDSKGKGKEQSLLDNPRLFVFVLGGLSHHEMCSIAELQETLPAQIVPGSNEIITPK